MKDRNAYMRQYWIDHPAQYDRHKANVMFKKDCKRFIKIIEKMEIMIYGYFYKMEYLENGSAKKFPDGEHSLPKEV